MQMALSNQLDIQVPEFSKICIPRSDWSYQNARLQHIQMVSEAVRLEEF